MFDGDESSLVPAGTIHRVAWHKLSRHARSVAAWLSSPAGAPEPFGQDIEDRN